MKIRRRVVTAVAAAAAVAAPLLIVPSQASWTDGEWVSGSGVSTSSFDCGTDTGYTSTASGRFVSGSLLGGDLDQAAEVSGVTLDLDSSGTATVDPATAQQLVDDPPTYANPLNVTALDGVVAVDLSGLNTGLEAGKAGALNQWVQASTTGTAAGASGLVDNSGGIGVTPTTGSAEPPDVATIGLGTLLPVVADTVANVELEIGAVAASSIVDGCDVLESALWGDGSATAQRDYGIASLGLGVDAPPLATLVPTVDSAVDGLNATVNGLVGSNGAIATALNGLTTSVLGSLLSTLGVKVSSTTVSISNLDLAGAVDPLLTEPLSDGVVTIDLSTGHIYADLAALMDHPDGLNDLDPNTELALDADVVNALVGRVESLLNTWTTSVTDALTTAIKNATLVAHVSVALTSVLGNVGSVEIGLNASVGDIIAGTVPTSAVTATFSLPLGISLDAGTLVSGLISGLSTTVAPLLQGLLDQVDTLGTTLSGITAPVVSTLATVLAPLSEDHLLTLMVNVQPDQPGAPARSTFVAATDDATAEYEVSALRIGVVDQAQTLTLTLATASAGPVTMPPAT
ncbi:choice-of-anchor G family protein [Gryllotalpicola ginsengisoli]|uniref:choice-of-anchor G family protein n=1 Tax=Gryllotalpicola ginsengisoli TaxID=444608 RepID=UPI0003B6FF9A|nr:choice-of-anchor G family protein [Gryllotalpicola ginsengisoli]